MDAIEKSGEIHEERHDYFTAQCIAEIWERMMHQYVTCVTEGVHFIVSQHDEGATFDQIARDASSPGEGGGAAWKYAPVFNLGSPGGFWQTMAIHEIQQERRRQDIPALLEALGEFADAEMTMRRRWQCERTG